MELKSMFNMQELRKKQQAIAVKYNRAEKAIKNLGLSETANEEIGKVLAAEMKSELNKVLNAEPEAPAVEEGPAAPGGPESMV